MLISCLSSKKNGPWLLRYVHPRAQGYLSMIHQLHQHLQPMKPRLLGPPWQGPRHWEPKAGDIGRGPVEALTTCGTQGPKGRWKPMAFPWKIIPMLANSQPKQWFLNWTYTKKGFRVSGKVLLCPSLEVKMKVSSAPMFVSSRKLMVEYGWTMMNLHTIKIQ